MTTRTATIDDLVMQYLGVLKGVGDNLGDIGVGAQRGFAEMVAGPLDFAMDARRDEPLDSFARGAAANPAPETPYGRVAQGVVSDLPYVAAFAPLGGLGGLAGILGELAAGTAGSIFSRTAEEQGVGEMGQLAADMVGNLTPGGVAASLASVPLVATTRSAKRGAKAAAKGPYTKIVPDVREFTTHADGLAIARHEPHLIQKKPGKPYTGAPPKVTNRRQLRAMRKRYDKLVAEGAKHGAKWYQRIGADISAAAPGRETQWANEFAMMSPQATPQTNTEFMLQGANSFEAGAPRDLVRTRGQAEQLIQHRLTGDPNLSRKTVQFARASDPTQPATIGGTHDLWDARAWGYPKDTLTANNHRFLDYEVVLATERANKNKLLGRSDWTSDEIQASAWSAIGGRDRLKQFGGDLDAAIESMANTDLFPPHVARGTYELTPSGAGQHFSELVDAPYPLREQYSADPRRSWVDPETGEDVLTRSSGLYQLSSEESLGQFVNPQTGKLEFNPGMNTRPLVAHDKVPVLDAQGNPVLDKEGKPKTRHSKITLEDESVLNKIEAVRGYVDAQEAAAWNKFLPEGTKGVAPRDTNSLRINTGNLTEKQIRDLTKVTDKLGYTTTSKFAIRNKNDTVLRDFTIDEGKPFTSAWKKLKKELDKAKLPYEVERGYTDSGYIDYELARKEPGKGHATRELFKTLSDPASPATASKLDSPELRKIAGSKRIADEDFAQLTGMKKDEYIQRAREIIESEGLDGLWRALTRGEALPLIGLPVLLEEQDELSR